MAPNRRKQPGLGTSLLKRVLRSAFSTIASSSRRSLRWNLLLPPHWFVPQLRPLYYG